MVYVLVQEARPRSEIVRRAQFDSLLPNWYHQVSGVQQPFLSVRLGRQHFLVPRHFLLLQISCPNAQFVRVKKFQSVPSSRHYIGRTPVDWLYNKRVA